MTDMTTEQQADIRADLAIPAANQTVFTDAEFNRLFTRADGNYDQTVVLALRQLRMNAAKFNDYTAGQTSERKQQIFANLGDMLQYYEDTVVNGAQQVMIAGMRPVPYAPAARPWNGELPIGVQRNRRDGWY